MQLVIEPGGVVRCIYTEEIDLAALGSPAISRPRTSSPTSMDAGGPICRRWAAPCLGPFCIAARPWRPSTLG